MLRSIKADSQIPPSNTYSTKDNSILCESWRDGNSSCCSTCFAKSGSITIDLPASGHEQNPYLPTSPFALPQRLHFLCFASVTHITKGSAAAVACFEAVHMARGLAEPDFLRQITERVSAVRALRQTGRWKPRERCLGGIALLSFLVLESWFLP